MIDDIDIFKYIDPQDNYKFSSLRSNDLLDLLVLINHYYLRYRQVLDVEKYITFGLEIEFEHITDSNIKNNIKKIFPTKEWIYKDDDYDLENGAEINTPILNNDKTTWQDIKTVCNYIEQVADIGNSSGGHIHIGSQILENNRDYWLRFLMLWSTYENIIFRFGYGEYLKERSNILLFAKPLSKDIWSDYTYFKNSLLDLPLILEDLKLPTKFNALNFNNIDSFNNDVFKDRNTIEFRNFNGTLNPIIWQNDFNFLTHFLNYAKSNNFNYELIDKRHNLLKKGYDNFKFYNEIMLEQALELADLIFNNNLDKIYFLKQYLKNFANKENNNNQKKLSLTL